MAKTSSSFFRNGGLVRSNLAKVQLPFSLSTLKLWYDASDLSTLSIDGSNRVYQWRDKSGNENHASQSVTNWMPVYTSIGIINFQRNTSVLRYSWMSIINNTSLDFTTQGFSIVSVVTTSNIFSGYILSKNVDSTANMHYALIHQDLTPNGFAAYINSPTITGIQSVTGAINLERQVVEMAWNTTNLISYLKGTQKTSTAIASPLTNRANISLGARYTVKMSNTGVSWTRSGTTITVTNNAHSMGSGVNGQVIIITASSNTSTIPLGAYGLNSTTTNTFTITGVATGATSGTLSYNAPGTVGFYGDMHEILIFSPALSSTERTKLNTYLTSKYALP